MPNDVSRNPNTVAVIGAGPYGLSVAAHLKSLGCTVRIFGQSMQTWRHFMPAGMILKSEGFAMNLSDPDGALTLEVFCREAGLPYQAIGWPVPVEIFAAYGEAFQKRFVPDLETVDVAKVSAVAGGFAVELADGARMLADRVVMATGIRPFARIVGALTNLPNGRVSHSADRGDLSQFAGQQVAVVGGGASAMDVAAALHRCGAVPTVITRRPAIRFYAPGSFRSLRDRLLAPMTPLGPGWKKYFCTAFPDLFHALPKSLRRKIVSRYLGPSPAWSVREIVQNHVKLVLNAHVIDSAICDDRVALDIENADGGLQRLVVDHVIAATGYGVDLGRLTMLEDALRVRLSNSGGAPFLSSAFESSVPGLYFVGTAASTSFGPMLRFVCGTDFAARRVSRHIASELDLATSRAAGALQPTRLAEA